MAAAAGSWIALASALGPRDYEPWLIFGILLALVFSFSALALWFSAAGPRIRNWQLSSLVIGPAGLAMVQGDMRGELRWAEVRRMRCTRRPRVFKWTIAAFSRAGSGCGRRERRHRRHLRSTHFSHPGSDCRLLARSRRECVSGRCRYDGNVTGLWPKISQTVSNPIFQQILLPALLRTRMSQRHWILAVMLSAITNLAAPRKS